MRAVNIRSMLPISVFRALMRRARSRITMLVEQHRVRTLPGSHLGCFKHQAGLVSIFEPDPDSLGGCETPDGGAGRGLGCAIDALNVEQPTAPASVQRVRCGAWEHLWLNPTKLLEPPPPHQLDRTCPSFVAVDGWVDPPRPPRQTLDGPTPSAKLAEVLQ